MPIRTVCPNTGAVIFTKTAEERQVEEVMKENKELKSQVTNLSDKLDTLTKLVETLTKE